MDDQNFWNQWNSRVANQWNAYDRGENVSRVNFGDFQNDYAQQQQFAAAPFAQRQAALMNQHRMGQDAFQNRMALMQEERLREAEGFNQRYDIDRLGMQEGLANQRAAQAALQNQLKGAASAYGVDDVFPLLQNYSEEMGYAELPGEKEGESPRQIRFSPQAFDSMSQLWNQANPNLPGVELLSQRAARRAQEQSLRQRKAEIERQMQEEQRKRGVQQTQQFQAMDLPEATWTAPGAWPTM